MILCVDPDEDDWAATAGALAAAGFDVREVGVGGGGDRRWREEARDEHQYHEYRSNGGLGGTESMYDLNLRLELKFVFE